MSGVKEKNLKKEKRSHYTAKHDDEQNHQFDKKSKSYRHRERNHDFDKNMDETESKKNV